MDSYEPVGVEHSPELRYDMGFTSYPTTTTDGLANGLAYPEYEWSAHSQETIHGARPGIYTLHDGVAAQYAPYLGYSNLAPEDMGVVPPPAYIPTGEMSFATPLTHLPYSGHENYYAHSYNNISPTSTSSGTSGTSDGRSGQKPKRKRVQNQIQRKAANVRERRRMFHLNEAFDELRKRLPAFNYEKRLSRIETLKLAMTYISFMKGLSEGKDPKDVPLLLTTKGEGTSIYSDDQDSDA